MPPLTRQGELLEYNEYERYTSPIAGLELPIGFQEIKVPRFHDERHRMVVRLSALRTGRLYPWIRPQGHSEIGRILRQ